MITFSNKASKLTQVSQIGEVKAFVFLREEGDENNKCIYTDKYLIVTIKGKRHYFELTNLKGIEIHARKLLLPLVFGGFVVPLSLVAIFRDYFDPYVIILTIFVGLYSIYIGWSGIDQLSVNLKNEVLNFSLPALTDHFKAFVKYVNATLSEDTAGQKQESLIYFAVKKEVVKKFYNSGLIPVEENQRGRRAATYQQMQTVRSTLQVDEVILSIDPHILKAGIKYQFDPELEQLCPFIFGDINTEAIFNRDEVI